MILGIALQYLACKLIFLGTMLKYKLALLSVGALYFRLVAFAVVGLIYCTVMLARYLRDSYLQKFHEKPL